MSRSPTTRSGLLELRSRRGIATKGAHLLRAKREVLAGETWKLMREVLSGRAKLDEVLREAVEFGIAAILRGPDSTLGNTPQTDSESAA